MTLTLDGMFLFKLFALSTIQELFTREHLSIPVQHSALDKYYRLMWFNATVNVFNSSIINIDRAVQLIEFCKILFDNFAPIHRQTFTSEKFTRPQIFNYSLESDRASTFSTSKFLKFIKNFPVDEFSSPDIIELRHELLQLISGVRNIKKKCKSVQGQKTDFVKFINYKVYRKLFKFLSIQYELTRVTTDTCGSVDSNNHDYAILIFATIKENCEENIIYNIETISK